MHVGVLTLELFIPHANSLKEKRRVVRRVKDRLKSRLNVAVAEVGNLDLWQRATLAVVAVNKDRPPAEALLQAALRQTEADHEAQVGEVEIEFF